MVALAPAVESHPVLHRRVLSALLLSLLCLAAGVAGLARHEPGRLATALNVTLVLVSLWMSAASLTSLARQRPIWRGRTQPGGWLPETLAILLGTGVAVVAIPAHLTGLTTISPLPIAQAAATLLVAGVTVKALSGPVSIAVVGDARFSERITDAVVGRDRYFVAHLDPTASESFSLLPGHDELVVDCRWIDDLDRLVPGARASGSRVIVVDPVSATSRRPANPFDGVLPRSGRWFKRVLDVLIATCALILVLPVMAVVAIAIQVDTKGPVLFSQVRVGADGRRFRLYKFRSMQVANDDRSHSEYVASLIRGDAVQHDGVYKLRNDPRITPIGGVLRRYSLDELPQLWNVLKGDMSLVGPRPPLPNEVALYDAEAMQRLRVRPGLTGLWQVSGRSELTFREMVALDVEYWKRWTPATDLAILLRTPATVLSGRGAV